VNGDGNVTLELVASKTAVHVDTDRAPTVITTEVPCFGREPEASRSPGGMNIMAIRRDNRKLAESRNRAGLG
jgi:hypothetical protein